MLIVDDVPCAVLLLQQYWAAGVLKQITMCLSRNRGRHAYNAIGLMDISMIHVLNAPQTLLGSWGRHPYGEDFTAG